MSQEKYKPWEVVEHNWEKISIYDSEDNRICSIDIEMDEDIDEYDQDALDAEQDRATLVMREKAMVVSAVPVMIGTIEDMKEFINEIANVIDNMHKPEYAHFEFRGKTIDGYEFAEMIREINNKLKTNDDSDGDD